MNPYTTWTQARIRPGDVARATLSDPLTAAAALAALERTRAYHAEAEVDWLLKEYGLAPAAVASRVVMLRQAIGATLVRLGARRARPAARGSSLETAPVSSMLRTAD